MSNELIVFFTAMAPIAELRLAIPLGISMDLPWFETFIISVLGNMLPVPFLILFARPVINWLKKFDMFKKIISRFELSTSKKADKIRTYVELGLFLFVAIPFPGTGAWTGAFIAALLDLRLKNAIPIIAAGVIGAGIIVTIITLISTGLISVFAIQ